jgi:RecA-family ATPase
MFSLAKFHTRAGNIGKPLPTPFDVFDFEGIRFRHGATSMIAGQPGSFKSVFALNMLVRWARMDETALYFSADSDEFTVARRCTGILTDIDQTVIESGLSRGQADYIESLKALNTARFEYRAMDIDKVAERLASYEQVYGEYPSVVFVDNLINYAESATDWGEMIDFIRELDALARETRSHICVLHHASEGGVKAGQPVPRRDIQGKVTQLPRLVLTTASEGPHLMVSCVKNTNGPQYPNADHWMDFVIRPSLQVEENERGYR